MNSGRCSSLSIETFESLGLDREIVDSGLWHTCQRERLILVTGNRNADGPDSLEETIRSSNTPQSLPVFTLANPRKILSDRAYATRVAIGLLEHLIEIDRYRGTGRIYLP